MSLISRRKRPIVGLLFFGLIAGAFCGDALLTGRFFLPLRGVAYRDHFVVQALDPRLFLFWVRVSACYFLGLSLLAFVRIDPIEDRRETLPELGRFRVTGHPRNYRAEGLLLLALALVPFVCYLFTLR